MFLFGYASMFNALFRHIYLLLSFCLQLIHVLVLRELIVHSLDVLRELRFVFIL